MSNKDGRVKDDGFIYMVLEYGEIDLAHMLSQKWREIEGSDRTIDENWLRFYWQVLTQPHQVIFVMILNYIFSFALEFFQFVLLANIIYSLKSLFAQNSLILV